MSAEWKAQPDGTLITRNETGRFVIDSQGILLKYTPDSFSEGKDGGFIKRIIPKVIIPEGVRQIGYWNQANPVYGEPKESAVIFRYLSVTNEIQFPSTLHCIGALEFSYCILPNVELPPSLTALGSGAFCVTQMGILTLSAGLTCWGGAAFAACRINTVIIPFGMMFESPSSFPSNKQLQIGGRNFKATCIHTLLIPDPTHYSYQRLFCDSIFQFIFRYTHTVHNLKGDWCSASDLIREIEEM